MASPFLASFGHALRGLLEVAARERTMKVHVLAGTAVGLVGSAVVLPLASRLALVVAVALVVGAELANSAIEAAVDLVTRDHRDEARRAKDAAAGGVLALSVGAVVVAAAVFGDDPDAFRQALERDGLHAVLAAGALGLEGWLLFGRPRSALRDGIAAAAGLAVTAVVGFHGPNPSLALVALVLFLLAAASAGHARREGGA